MRYAALAADYDGTLAAQGRVQASTVDALRRLAASGRKLVLVTGRELDELLAIFPDVAVFDRVVAENGAVLYCPATKGVKLLGAPPPSEFAAELLRRGVDPLSVGRCIVATVTPNEGAVLDAIRHFGLELQVVFNKGAVMVLPAGVNKASGLAAALQDLHLSARNVAAIGDAENDHALLRCAEFGAAVANALPMLKRDADWVSTRSHGDAVVELIDAMLADDLGTLAPARSRRTLTLGARRSGEAVAVPAAGCDLFVAGPSGSGKSIFVAALLERLAAEGYQYCVFDPEGDYAALDGAIVLGSAQRAPTLEELSSALAQSPHACLVVSLAALPATLRLAQFKAMLSRVREARTRLGRPHWLVTGEAQRMFPRGDADRLLQPQEGASSVLYVSAHPEQVSPAVLASVSLVIVVGNAQAAALADYCRALGLPSPAVAERPAEYTEAIGWFPRSNGAPFVFQLAHAEHAEQSAAKAAATRVDLPPDRSFYFRGPLGKQNLRVQNLPLFVQIGRGVDEETWLHHLSAGDYSRWLRAAVGDATLTAQVAAIEAEGGSAELTRERVAAAIESYLQR